MTGILPQRVRAHLAIVRLVLGSLLSVAAAHPIEAPAQNARLADSTVLHVPRARGPIQIDGEIDDSGWNGAAKAVNFIEFFPNEGGRPNVASEVWVTYDDRHLFLAFLAFDDPTTVRASRRDRDEIWSDDYFGILLDTFGDAAWAYFLSANPLGIQGDSRFTTAGDEDEAFDLLYNSAGRITVSGYQIEMAIPFASLRFPNEPVQEWRATFWRTRPRGSSEEYSWAAIERNEPCFLCQLGTLRGIQGVEPGGALELLPGIVASHTGRLRDASDPRSGFRNDGVEGEASLGIRYAFTSGLTAEGTFNPEFSQVESDVAQIDINSTFALFLPERRPFFQEGSDLFEMPFDVLHTRQINNPQFATKLVGRLGRSSVVYLGARDETSPLLLPFQEQSFVGEAGKSVSNIVRIRRTFSRDSYVGAVVSDRHLEEGGSGTVGGIDGRFRFFGNYALGYQFLGSHVREPDDTSLTSGINDLTFAEGLRTAMFDGESLVGFAQYTSLERSARFWNFDIDYWSSSPTFRTDNGFEFSNDFRRISMWQGLFFYPNTKVVTQVTPNIYVERSWNHGGVRKVDLVEPSISFELAGQTTVEFWYSVGRERFANVEFDGIRHWNVRARSEFIDPVSLEVYLSRGKTILRDLDAPLLGVGTDAEVVAVVKLFSRLVVEPSVEFSRLSEPNDGPELFSSYIVRARTSLQFTREFFLRLVVQYNDFSGELNIEPLVTYTMNPFTLFYIGSAHAYRNYGQPDRFEQTSRQLFAKFQYLFRR
jgi:hypothetical protein